MNTPQDLLDTLNKEEKEIVTLINSAPREFRPVLNSIAGCCYQCSISAESMLFITSSMLKFIQECRTPGTAASDSLDAFSFHADTMGNTAAMILLMETLEAYTEVSREKTR
jgi:hypothetical protein